MTPSDRGFSLIEALVAIVVLALSLSTLLSSHNSALRGAGAVDEHLQARLLAQSLLAQFSQLRTPQEAAHGQSGRFAWDVSLVPYAKTRATGPSTQPERWQLHALTVRVAWAPNRRVELATLRLLSAP